MKRILQRLLIASISTICVLPAPAAADAEGADDAVKLEWNTRLRHESVDDDATARAAAASTMRLRLGARAHFGTGWSALVEGEGIVALDNEYNSGANGSTRYPVIPDAEGAQLNQAWISWRNELTAGTLGRQRILLDNQRWVGNSGWRQNEQTFDAAALEWKPSSAVTARYFWLDRVHRVNGDDARDRLARERQLDTHLLDVAFVRGSQQWGAYRYAHKDRDVPGASTLTTGGRWTGNQVKEGTGWGWRLEAARQVAHANNPIDFAHSYWMIEPTLTRSHLTWRAGWEHLGGNGRHALQTPLATLHPFNGWADKFLVTPAGGLEDRYVGASGAFGQGELASKLKWALTWHDYRSDVGGRYGSEWDASLSFPVRGKITGLLKLAEYQSEGFACDTTKLWLQFEWVH